MIIVLFFGLIIEGERMMDFININAWEGAQWVLITCWFTLLFLRILLRLAIPSGQKMGTIKMPEWPEWIGETVGMIIKSLFLFVILAWGGFWT
jgi:hypothetical protein